MSSEFFLDDKWIKKIDHQSKDLFGRIGFDRKTIDEVFDKPTLLNLGKLISDKVIEYLDFPISTGKEAIVFRGVTKDKKFVALKIYRTSNTVFKHIWKYIEGDPRFRYANRNRREIVYDWTKKEFKNLELLNKIKIRVPRPIKMIKNILVLDYVGYSKKSAPLLKDVSLKYPNKIFDELLKFISLMYSKAGFVHADLSPYNVLFYRNNPYIIDVGQGVLLEHPLSLKFLRRDIHNILKFFKKFDIIENEEVIFNRIIEKK